MAQSMPGALSRTPDAGRPTAALPENEADCVYPYYVAGTINGIILPIHANFYGSQVVKHANAIQHNPSERAEAFKSINAPAI